MYTEEYLPDDAIDYYDTTDISIEETSSVSTQERDKRKLHELYKRSDPDYYSYKTIERDEDGNRIIRKTQIYSSPNNGRIRNASTGIRESDFVGSRSEDSYFTMKDVAVCTKTLYNKEPRKLFYSNPEECERHLKIVLSREIKEAWHNKQNGINSLNYIMSR